VAGYERLDRPLLAVLSGSDWLTAAQIRARCADPWAVPLVDDWLRDASARGLVTPRRSPSQHDAVEFRLTRRGLKRTQERAGEVGEAG